MQRNEALLAKRNGDGSWPYRSGVGLMETTCYALLAQHALGVSLPDANRSLDWLSRLRQSDGGFAPQSSVAQSNWTTAIAAIVFGTYGREAEHRSAVNWLLDVSGKESSWWIRTVRSTMRIEPPYPQDHDGWPWVAGTTAWLMPTALGMLALMHAKIRISDSALEARIQEAEQMILDRRCIDGGWNHGAPAALEVDAHSYPETTGVALLALQRIPAEKLPGGDELGQKMLATNRFANAVSWLQMGLNARGIAVEPGEETAIQCRNTLDSALRVLALSAIGGNNILKL